ncbi:metallophosphoesterase [Nesterenkonia aerolata]|uniref:Metallophosphoesterase n=1 Tax=Nesterenkonia aerolata TaxID=3074079 RepID=A0ABU2DRX4_9MICC|nr:metallophosphoesterase [Nesterenkonia sp. LY-0111]MDR8019257.1 metallophosphoesterase [Nesterenkonia sp. LY-0111]
MPALLRQVGTASALGAGLSAAVGVGVGALAYGRWIGARRFRLQHHELELLPAGARPLRLLHISDIHFVPGDRGKAQWLQSLAELEPDLVINTGDNLSYPESVPQVLEALAPLRRFPGVFVPGSNDYFIARRKNPLAYLLGPSRLAADPPQLPWRSFFAQLSASGWVDLTNRSHQMSVGGRLLQFSGVDDPHIDRDRFPGWPAGTARSNGVRIGVAHAPVRRVLQRFAETGADLILAGHTHGGQVCLPGERALTTNCDLPRRQAKGISTVRAGSGARPASGAQTALHVSGGIGTVVRAPFRLNCPPEACVIDLLPHH